MVQPLWCLVGHNGSWLFSGFLFPKPWLWELVEDRLVILNLTLHSLLPCYAWPTPFPYLTFYSIFQTQWESLYLLLKKVNSSTCQFPHWKHFHHRGLQVTGVSMHPGLCSLLWTGAPAKQTAAPSEVGDLATVCPWFIPHRHTWLWWCGEVPGSLAGLGRVASIGLTLVGIERGNNTLWNLAY